jgi:hypothetical protein
MKTTWTLGVCVLAGAASGAGVSLFVTAPARAPVASVASPPLAAELGSNVGTPASADDIARVEREFAELRDRQREIRLERPPSVQHAATPRATAPASPEDPTVAREREVKLFRAELSAHSNEAVDPGWAQSQTGTLTRELGVPSSSAGVEVESVDCRMTTCVATLQFRDWQTASRNWRRVLEGRYERGCGVEIVLDGAPEDPAKPYGANALFDCEQERTGGDRGQ